MRCANRGVGGCRVDGGLVVRSINCLCTRYVKCAHGKYSMFHVPYFLVLQNSSTITGPLETLEVNERAFRIE